MTATIHTFKTREELDTERMQAKLNACRYTVDFPRLTFAVVQNAAAYHGVTESELLGRLIHEHLTEAHEAYRNAMWPDKEAS